MSVRQLIPKNITVFGKGRKYTKSGGREPGALYHQRLQIIFSCVSVADGEGGVWWIGAQCPRSADSGDHSQFCPAAGGDGGVWWKGAQCSLSADPADHSQWCICCRWGRWSLVVRSTVPTFSRSC